MKERRTLIHAEGAGRGDGRQTIVSCPVALVLFLFIVSSTSTVVFAEGNPFATYRNSTEACDAISEEATASISLLSALNSTKTCTLSSVRSCLDSAWHCARSAAIAMKHNDTCLNAVGARCASTVATCLYSIALAATASELDVCRPIGRLRVALLNVLSGGEGTVTQPDGATINATFQTSPLQLSCYEQVCLMFDYVSTDLVEACSSEVPDSAWPGASICSTFTGIQTIANKSTSSSGTTSESLEIVQSPTLTHSQSKENSSIPESSSGSSSSASRDNRVLPALGLVLEPAVIHNGGQQEDGFPIVVVSSPDIMLSGTATASCMSVSPTNEEGTYLREEVGISLFDWKLSSENEGLSALFTLSISNSLSGVDQKRDATFAVTVFSDCFSAEEDRSRENSFATLTVLYVEPEETISKEVVAVTSQVGASMAAAGALAASSGGSAPAAARLISLQTLVQCDFLEPWNKPLPWMEHPFYFAITSAKSRYYVGAAVMNFVLLLIFAILLVAAGHLFGEIKYHGSLRKGLLFAQFPGFTIVPMMFFLQFSIQACFAVVLHEDNNTGAQIIAYGALAIWICVILVVSFIVTSGFKGRYKPQEDTELNSVSLEKKNLEALKSKQGQSGVVSTGNSMLLGPRRESRMSNLLTSLLDSRGAEDNDDVNSSVLDDLNHDGEEGEVENSQANRCQRHFESIFLPDGLWEDAKPLKPTKASILRNPHVVQAYSAKRQAVKGFNQRYGAIFGDFRERRQQFVVVDLMCSTAFGIAGALPLGKRSCETPTITLIAVSALYFVLVTVLRPKNTFYYKLSHFFIGLIQFLIPLFLALDAKYSNRDLADYASVLGLLGLFLVILEMFIGLLLLAYVRFCSMEAKNKRREELLAAQRESEDMDLSPVSGSGPVLTTDILGDELVSEDGTVVAATRGGVSRNLRPSGSATMSNLQQPPPVVSSPQRSQQAVAENPQLATEREALKKLIEEIDGKLERLTDRERKEEEKHAADAKEVAMRDQVRSEVQRALSFHSSSSPPPPPPPPPAPHLYRRRGKRKRYPYGEDNELTAAEMLFLLSSSSSSDEDDTIFDRRRKLLRQRALLAEQRLQPARSSPKLRVKPPEADKGGSPVRDSHPLEGVSVVTSTNETDSPPRAPAEKSDEDLSKQNGEKSREVGGGEEQGQQEPTGSLPDASPKEEHYVEWPPTREDNKYLRDGFLRRMGSRYGSSSRSLKKQFTETERRSRLRKELLDDFNDSDVEELLEQRSSKVFSPPKSAASKRGQVPNSKPEDTQAQDTLRRLGSPVSQQQTLPPIPHQQLPSYPGAVPFGTAAIQTPSASVVQMVPPHHHHQHHHHQHPVSPYGPPQQYYYVDPMTAPQQPARSIHQTSGTSSAWSDVNLQRTLHQSATEPMDADMYDRL